MRQSPFNRRAFLAAGAATSLSAATYERVSGSNERVQLGFIGFGLIGKRHVLDFKQIPDVALVAIAETHADRLAEGADTIGGPVAQQRDFRALLDQRDVDAVVVSTPDHWHGLMTILACAAGKDVYVEKPASLFVREGRWMVSAAQRHGRIVQVGTQQRSGPHYQRARELVQNGHIGNVHSVRMWAYRNIMPGFGKPPDGDAPEALDYDLWLGPAPQRPYNPNRALYHFRWFWDYSGGQMTNLASHSLDIVHWFMNVDAPLAVTSVGGRLALEDNGETPDTQDTLFVYPGFTATWSHREAARGAAPHHGLVFCGTKGTLTISRKGFTVTADPKIAPGDAIPRFGGAHPSGGPSRTGGDDEQRRDGPLWTTPLEDNTGDEFDQFRRHAGHFLDCVRTRARPISDIESGHRVATACHLANISLLSGQSLRWGRREEAIIDNSVASARLERPYRTPWDKVLVR